VFRFGWLRSSVSTEHARVCCRLLCAKFGWILRIRDCLELFVDVVRAVVSGG
jgi:hypothetical protein